ncbi:MAG: AsmA-like C-terminal region-containing protein, partial [Cytophagales bacterium]|nr:AsmA-like C-terminal region-containing protein [Cytophaga sp.]
QKAFLKGVFTNGPERELSSSSVRLSDLRFELDNKTIEGYFYLTNLDDPFIDTRLKGSINLLHLLRMIPKHPFEQASGELDFDIEFKGKSEDLKTKAGYQNVYTAGDLGLTNIIAKFNSYPHIIGIKNAICTFNKNDISISDMSLSVGKNHINMSGIFRNLIGKMIFPDQAMYVQADLEMGNIFLEEILMADQRNSGSSDQGFIMPLLKDYKMELSLKAESMKYHRFHAKNISSSIQWNYPLLTFSNSSLNFCSGTYTGNTSLNALSEKVWEIKTDSKIRNMNIDSLFYVFENFSQDFITDKNLKGQISSDISLLMQLDNHLNVLPASIICDADLTVQNGELNNFETMKKMARFLDSENLDNVRFSEMKNHFLIFNQEIQIPDMTIVSTAGKIGISGKHAFDGHIEYHIAYPMKNLKKSKTDSDEAFGAIRKDPKGEMSVFLIIKGTTTDFKITYDKKKTGEKIVSDIQKEKKELKALFKKKDADQQQIKQTQQEEQEYFDF